MCVFKLIAANGLKSARARALAGVVVVVVVVVCAVGLWFYSAPLYLLWVIECTHVRCDQYERSLPQHHHNDRCKYCPNKLESVGARTNADGHGHYNCFACLALRVDRTTVRILSVCLSLNVCVSHI